ncbi:hypothetical protein [Flavobacterium limnophilum]|uniref:hypothetical protein n=1 Tax=Flavobacterium limnophilum TaxID=3003262 RepID=UPI002482B465|nr:hypothetical protein [Flavobacterium limnophilum]
MKLTKLFVFWFLSVLFSVFAQVHKAVTSGKVIDEDGLPIPDVPFLLLKET